MSRKNQKKRLDAIWSRLVVERDSSTCQFTGCGAYTQNPHHVFLKGKYGSRWELDNGINLCEIHHVPYAHAFPEDFMEWWRGKVGEEMYEAVKAASMRIKIDLDEVEIELKGMI